VDAEQVEKKKGRHSAKAAKAKKFSLPLVRGGGGGGLNKLRIQGPERRNVLGLGRICSPAIRSKFRKEGRFETGRALCLGEGKNERPATWVMLRINRI